jgi:AsmA protein
VIRFLKWAGIVVGSIVTLVVLAALLFPCLLSPERYRSALTNRVTKALGREVALGSLCINLWGGIGAEAKDIRIAQAPGFGSEPFLAAEALRVRVQFLPLLRGQVRVSTAVVERPRIRLTHAKDGRWSIDDLLKPHAAPPPPKTPAEPPRAGKTTLLGALLLNEVAIKNGEITLSDQTRSPSLTLGMSDLDLAVRQANLADPLEVQYRAKIVSPGAGRLEASGRIAMADGENPTVDLTVALRDLETAPWQALFVDAGGVKLSGALSAEVKMAGSPARATFTGNVNLKPVLIQVGELFQKTSGEEAGLSFEGRREENGINLPKFTVTLKEVKVNGSLAIPNLAAPSITFTASSPKVDLDRLLAKTASRAAWLMPAVADAAPPPPSGTQSKPGPPGLAAQGKIAIGDLRYQGLTWTAVQADIRYLDGVARLPAFQADFMNGKITAKGEVDLRPKVPRVTAAGRLEGIATGPLIQALNPGAWTLRSSLHLDSDISFAGFSKPDILGSAKGEGSILVKDGRLVGYKPLERLSEVISPILVAQGVRARLDEFDQVSGHYTVDKGMLRTKDLTLTKTEGTVTAVGMLGLLDSSLDFDVVAKLGRTTIEAKVTGTTNQPIVVPKLGRLQRKIETELDKALPGEQGKGLKGLFKGLFGK